MVPGAHDQRIKKGEQTRADILYAAIGIIAEDGVGGVSTSKLASGAGVSRSTIFHHFRTTHKVLESTLHLVFEELLQSMRNEEYRDVEHFLDALGRFILQAPDANPTVAKAFFSFFHESMFDSIFQEILASYIQQMNAFYREQLSRLVPESVTPETIESVTRLILPMMDGIGFHYFLTGDRAQYRKIWELQSRAIVQQLDVKDGVEEGQQ